MVPMSSGRLACPTTRGPNSKEVSHAHGTGGRGAAFDVKHAEDGDRWAARLEIYETDPDPDMSKWTTQLLFRLSD
jgi:hypothetical protein